MDRQHYPSSVTLASVDAVWKVGHHKPQAREVPVWVGSLNARASNSSIQLVKKQTVSHRKAMLQKRAAASQK